MHICTSFVELLHAKIELQQNELMISNREEYPALLSLTCQSIENPFEKIQSHSKWTPLPPRILAAAMWGRCGRGGSLLFLDDRCNLRPVLLAVQSSELSSSFGVLSNSLAVAHYIF